MARIKIPQNVLVLATHGSAKIPSCARRNLDPFFTGRLQRNFSDFATKSLLNKFPKSQIAFPRYGRIVGDPNRSDVADDLFRIEDFNGVRIWKTPLSDKQKRKYLRQSRRAYIDSILSKIEELCKTVHRDKPIIILDLHDTGNRLLAVSPAEDRARKSFVMPKAIFSNHYNMTSKKEFLQSSIDLFCETFGVCKSEAVKNDIFHGGFITQFFGGVEKNHVLEKMLRRYGRTTDSLFVVQCELNRDLYLDEAQQKIRPSIGRIRRCFEQFVSQISAF